MNGVLKMFAIEICAKPENAISYQTYEEAVKVCDLLKRENPKQFFEVVVRDDLRFIIWYSDFYGLPARRYVAEILEIF